MSNYKQFLKDLKQAKCVYGYVLLNKDCDGQYLQLTKVDVRTFTREGDEIDYQVCGSAIYIN